MSNICKNCNNKFTGNFCNKCGQSADTNKINFHFLWHDIKKGLFHYDSGVLFTAKELFTRPGNTIREFISGKRVKHIKPISLVILLATFYAFLIHVFHIELFSNADSATEAQKITNFITEHFSWVTLLTIPVYTVGTFISFRKQGYNFVELIILNSFKASQRLYLRIFTFPILYFIAENGAAKKLYLIYYSCDLILTYWTNAQFFNKLTLVKSLFYTLLSHLIFLTLIVAILYLAITIVGFF